MRYTPVLWAAVALTLAWPSIGKAQVGQWQLLGQRTVSAEDERESIPVTSTAGRISRIQIRVADNEVQIHRVVLSFAEGPREAVMVDRLLPSGGRTPGLEIPGSNRTINRAEVVYHVTGDASRGAPTIQLWGLLAGPRLIAPIPHGLGAPPQPAPPTPLSDIEAAGPWRSLGEGRIDLEGDRSVVEIEAGADVARLVILSADTEIHLISIRVTFSGGEPQLIQVDHLVEAGRRSPEVELDQGRGRPQRIELRYRAGEGTSGLARVVVLGASESNAD